MKTITGIEIYDVQAVKNGYLVEYSTGESDVTITIADQFLIDFIVNNNLNQYCIDVLTGDYQTENPADTLEDDYFTIVVQYLNDLHKC